MKHSHLEYPLQNGYIHHWLVVGTQASEVKALERFSGTDWKLQNRAPVLLNRAGHAALD